MKAQFKAENPNEIEMTLTVTMPLADWKRLKDQTSNVLIYPGNQINSQIRAMIRYAEEHFEPLNVEDNQ